MADVTGQITGSDGTKDVRLNNAATEATLKALLANSSIDTAILKQIAQKAGVSQIVLDNLEAAAAASATNIRQATVATQQLTASQNNLKEHSQLVDSSFYSLIESAKLLASGNASVSGVLTLFKGMPGPLGLVITGFSALAEFQEKNMLTYQSMSTAGANFGGSLTDMRLAAQGSFVSLEQFGNLIKNNSRVLASMGGTVEDGARAFAAMSNSLLTSDAGKNLLALGYTTQDVNQGMLTYIAATGGRSKEEMKNTQALTASTTEYLTELDKLTQFSGVSRKQQEEDAKKAAANGAYQRALANMTEEQKARAEIGRQAAANSGIAGAQEAYMSKIAGLPPITKDAQQFVGMFGEAANGLYATADAALNVNGSMKDTEKGIGQFNQGVVTGTKGAETAFSAIAMGGNTVANGALLYATKLEKSGNDTAEGTAKNLAKAEQNQKTQADSQAATMAKAEIQLKEFGLAIMKLISPIISVLTPALQYLGPILGTLAAGMLAYKAFLIFEEIMGRAKIAREAGGGALATARTLMGGGPATTAAATVASGAARTVAGGAARAAAGAAGELIPGAAATSSSGGILGKVLGGLADGLKQMGDPKVMLGIVSVGLLGGAMMIAGKAFKEFSGVSWGDVLIGSVVLTALAVGAAALVEIAPFIAISAVAIGLLGGAIYLLAKGLKEFPTMAIPGMSEAFEGFGKIVGTVFDFVGGIITGLVDTVKTVFGTVWDIISFPFKMIGNLISGTVDVVTGMFGILWNVISFPFKMIGNLISGTVDVVTGMFGILWDVISWPFKQLGSLISGTIDVVTGMFGILWDVISFPFKMIGSLISGTVDVITAMFGIVWNVISFPFKMIGSLISGTVGVITTILGGLVDGISAIFGTVWSVITFPWRMIGSLISGTVGVITAILGGLVDGISAIFGMVWDVISFPFKMIGSLISGTGDSTTDLFGGMLDIVKGIFGMVWNVISFPFKMIGGLISGTMGIITGIFEGMMNVITGIFGTVWNVVSWPFKQIGNLVSGTVDGITSIFTGMVDGISAIFGTVWDIVSWPFKQIGNLVSDTIDGITSVFTGMVDGISALFGTLWNIISSPFKLIGDLVSGAVNVISSVFGTVWDILSSPFKMIGALVSSVFDGISGAIKFVVDKLSNILGMVGSIIKGVAGFVGRLFGGGEDKDEKGGTGSPEFTKATSVLLEAANKMNAVGDKLMAGAGSIGKNSGLAGSSGFDSVLSSASMNKAMSSIFKPKALDLPPMTENAKKLAATGFEEKGPSLEEKTHTELVSLNSTMKDLLRYIKDTADNTKKTHEATKNLNGNAFAI
jgi:phage-related protein